MNSNAKIDGDTIRAEIWYPRDGDVRFVDIDLVDVRASDGIRVHYDFSRDGWVIEQPTKMSWSADDETCDQCWKEVAFVKSWQLEAEQNANDAAAKEGK